METLRILNKESCGGAEMCSYDEMDSVNLKTCDYQTSGNILAEAIIYNSNTSHISPCYADTYT